MHEGERASVPQAPPVIPPVVRGYSSASTDPYVELSAQFQEYSLKISSQFEKMSARQKEIQQGYQNDLMHICSSI